MVGKTTVRKGRMLAKDGSLELWVVPAEAGGWRAEIMKRGKSSYAPALQTTWKRTRAEAGAVARGMKARFFTGR